MLALNTMVAGALLATALYHLARLIRRSDDPVADLSHLSMAGLMAFMLLRPIESRFTPPLALLFIGVCGRFALRWTRGHRATDVQHLMLAATMVYMLRPGRTAMAGMAMAPDAARLPVTALSLIGVLLVLSVWNVDQLGLTFDRLNSPGSGGPIALAGLSCRLVMCLGMSYALAMMG